MARVRRLISPVRRRIGEAALEAGDGFRELLGELQPEPAQVALRGIERVGVQHADELAREPLLVALRDLREHVPHQVHGAALLPRLGEHLAGGGDEPRVLVADDELNARESAYDELTEQLGQLASESCAPMCTPRSWRCPSSPVLMG